MGMLHLVHHPLYVSTGPVGGQFPWDKYGLLLMAINETGAVALHEP